MPTVTAPSPTNVPERRRRVAVVAAMFLVAVIAWGVGFYGLGFYLRELRRTHGWSLQTVTLATMWFYVASIGTSLVVRRMLRRGRQRAVFVVGGVALAASLVAMSQVDARWQLAGTYLGLALAWSCLSTYPISATILTWYPEGSGPPLSLALTGASVGGLVLVPLLTDLEDRFGFGPSVAGVGVGAGLVLVLLSAFVIRVPAAADAGDAGETVADAGSAAGGTAGKGNAADVLGDVRFWTLALGFGLSFTVQVGFLLHQLSVLSDHLADGVAARIVAGTSLGALVGRLVFGALTRRGDPYRPTLAYLALQTVALAVVATGTDSGVALAVGSLAFGLGVGTLITAPPLWVRTVLDRVPFELAYYRVNVALMAGAALGPILTTVLHDHLGGYGWTLAVLAGLDAVALGLLVLTPRLGRRAPTVAAFTPATNKTTAGVLSPG